jgi:hypothetical protein
VPVVELALKNAHVDQRQGRHRTCGLTSHEQLRDVQISGTGNLND